MAACRSPASLCAGAAFMRGARPLRVALVGLLLALSGCAGTPSRVATGFTVLPQGSKVVMMPPDIELFELDAGGVLEPKADWTETAQKAFGDSMLKRETELSIEAIELADPDSEEVLELNALHGAVAEAIAKHQFGPSAMRLPTKGGNLDWSLGDAVQPVHVRTGADFALFVFLRDSYASSGRVATMVVVGLLTFGQAVMTGGSQVGYASLVDLNSGRVVWFNGLARHSGDLRDPRSADETVRALLDGLPVGR